MATHAVVRTDKMYGTDVRAGLVSVKYMGSGGETPTAIDNGNVVLLDKLADGEREIFVGKDVAVDSPLKDVVLVASPEVMYDERLRNLSDYENEAGKACRGYYLHDGDIFSVTKDALTGEGSPAVGHVVELAAGTKLSVATAATGTSTLVGKIIQVEKTPRYTYYVILVGGVAATSE